MSVEEKGFRLGLWAVFVFSPEFYHKERASRLQHGRQLGRQ